MSFSKERDVINLHRFPGKRKFAEWWFTADSLNSCTDCSFSSLPLGYDFFLHFFLSLQPYNVLRWNCATSSALITPYYTSMPTCAKTSIKFLPLLMSPYAKLFRGVSLSLSTFASHSFHLNPYKITELLPPQSCVSPTFYSRFQKAWIPSSPVHGVAHCVCFTFSLCETMPHCSSKPYLGEIYCKLTTAPMFI